MILVRCACEGHDHEVRYEVTQMLYPCPLCGLVWNRYDDRFYSPASLRSSANAD